MHKVIVDAINNKVTGANAVYEERENGDDVIFVDAAAIHDVCLSLRDDQAFKVLNVISGTDYEDRIEVSYMLSNFNPENLIDLIIKVKVGRDNPKLQTVSDVWNAADWQERECYDMLGVTFEGHPDHRRILCPDDWEGFPLRRDYKAAEKYKDLVIYPANKMNNPEREFADVQKNNKDATRPELDWA